MFVGFFEAFGYSYLKDDKLQLPTNIYLTVKGHCIYRSVVIDLHLRYHGLNFYAVEDFDYSLMSGAVCQLQFFSVIQLIEGES